MTADEPPGRDARRAGDEAEGGSRRRWIDPAVLVVFALALFLRLDSLHEADRTPYPEHLSFLDDARYYAHHSEQIAGGKLVGDHSFFMGPLYPYSLALASAVLGLEPISPPPTSDEVERYDYHEAFLLQAVQGALSAVLVLLVARRLFGKGWGLLAGLLAATHGMFIYMDGLLMPSSQVLFVGLLATLALLVAGERTREGRPAARAWCLAGLGLGFSALAKGPALVMVPAAILWVWVAFPGLAVARRAAHSGALALCALLPISLATLHNHLADGDLVLLTSNGGPNLLTGNGPRATGAHAGISMKYKSAKLAFYLYEMERPAEEPPASVVSRELAREAWAHMLADPARAAALLWKKFRMFWNAAEVGTNDHYHFFRRFDRALRWPTPGYGVIAAFGLVGSFWLLRRWRELFPLHAFLFSQAAVYTGIFVLGRFRLIAAALCMVFAVGFLARCVEAARARRPRSLAVAGLLAAATLVFTHVPVEGMGPERGTANQYFLLGRALALAGEDAVPSYEAALAAHWREGNSSVGQRIRTHVRLGDHHRDAGRHERALEHYAAAREALADFSPGAAAIAEWEPVLDRLLRETRAESGG